MSRKYTRGWLLGIAIVPLAIMTSVSSAFGLTIRWDIVSINFTASPPTVSAGGIAAALTHDGATIKLTGSGTFVVPAGGGTSSAVTGGGTWATEGSVGTTGGTYAVTELLSWQVAPGVVPISDLIGNAADARAGLAVLGIKYSDGSLGVLVISCHLFPAPGIPGSPPSVFEGITATKGFVDFFDRAPPVGGVDANRTVFHVQ